MLKKYKKTVRLFFAFMFLYSTGTLATTGLPITVTVNNIATTDGYYSFQLFLYPFDKNTAEAVPTALGTGFLNRYLIGITGNEKNYLEFGYYDNQTQETTWFPETCRIVLDQSENISVSITPSSCAVT